MERCGFFFFFFSILQYFMREFGVVYRVFLVSMVF